MKKTIADIRKDYQLGEMRVSQMPEDPITAFEKWLHEAIESEAEEPTSFTLSTIAENGYPHSRVVLLKGVENHQLVFFTNYLSSKGKDIQQNPKVAMNFFWPELERQIRIKGIAQKLDAHLSDEYFYSRPLSSQAGAIVSAQSTEISEELNLQEEINKLLRTPEKIKRPIHWGGYAINPEYIEFWQGRPSRIHDRVFYQLTESLKWKKGRLSP